MLAVPDLKAITEDFYGSIQEKLDIELSALNIEVRGVFTQGWGSTSLGFSGIGGDAVTIAYTIVVQCKGTNVVGVYFGNRLAYIVLKPNQLFWTDLEKCNMKPDWECNLYSSEE